MTLPHSIGRSPFEPITNFLSYAIGDEPVRTREMTTAHSREWHLGSQNDGLFIIDMPPRPSNDHPVHEYRKGISPDVVLPIGIMGRKQAQAICDAHNASIRAIAGRDEQSAAQSTGRKE